MNCPLPLDELEALLHLRQLPRLGDVRLRRLLREHGSPRRVLALPPSELGMAGVAARGSGVVLERVRRGLRAIEELGVDVFVIDRPGYPAELLPLHDPPCLLCARGRLELLERPCVAVVGSRRHTQYGASATESIVRDLSSAGVVIVSGLARGIDGVAHAAALAGGTVAVLGCGIDIAYPREHRQLFERICAEGLALSEFCPGEPPLAFHFPQRNRIIAALARAVLVVEATGDSGSLITVDHANDLGKDVLAVPGPIGRDTSLGSNALIQDGARLVMCAEDVVAVLNAQGGRPRVGTCAPVRGTAGDDGDDGSRPGVGGPANADIPAAVPEETDSLDGRTGDGPAVGRLSTPASCTARTEDMCAPRRAGRTQAGTTVPATGLEPDPARRLRRHPGRRVGAGVGRGAATAAIPAGLGPEARALLEALDVAPRHVDELATGCRLTPARALAELLGLELQGHARQLPGARFVRA